MLWFEAFRVSPSPVTSETGTGRSLHPFQIDLSRPRDFLSIRGLDNSILDVQLNGKPQLQYFSKSMVGPGFSKKPTFHMSSTGARIVLSERKQKSYVTPPPPCFFYEEKKKNTHFQTRLRETRAWWCSETRSAKVWSTWLGRSIPRGIRASCVEG